MSSHGHPAVFDEPEEPTELVIINTSVEDEKTDFIVRPESDAGRGRDTSKDGSLFAFLFRLN